LPADLQAALPLSLQPQIAADLLKLMWTLCEWGTGPVKSLHYSSGAGLPDVPAGGSLRH